MQTPASEISPSSKSKTSSSSIAEHIETLSLAILEDHCNAKDFNTSATAAMSPSFRAKHDGLPTARCREQHINNLKAHFKIMPDFHLQVLNVSAEVDEPAGVGTVYIFFRLSRLVKDLERESVAVLRWEKRNDDWICVKHTGMRGPAGFPPAG